MSPGIDTLPWFERRKTPNARGERASGGGANDTEDSGESQACRCDRRPSRGAAPAPGLVCAGQAGSPLARVRRSLSHLGERDHAPTDAGGACEGVLRAFHGEVSQRACPRRRAGAGGAQALGGSRLLSPRSADACCGPENRGRACGRVSALGRRPHEPAGHRPLYGRRDRLDRDGSSRADRRGQLAAGACTAGRSRPAGWRRG